jgi:hypothetical protein
MIPEPPPNAITRPYRGLSVQETDCPLTPLDLSTFMVGREVYRRTEFLVLHKGSSAAFLTVRAASREPLFSPVVDVRVLSVPAQTVWIDDPDTDVGNASALARTALRHHRDGALAYVVRGRYEHINVIWRPAPIRIRVTEVVPPEPPKLYAMAQQVVGFDEDLPPIELVLDAVDVRTLAAENPSEHYLLPCRGSGIDLPGTVSFLDTRPAERRPWLMIGCERSRQFHEHFYGETPPRVDLCPKARAGPPGELPVLAKCCLRERGVELADRLAVVPWGSNLDEVRHALRALCGLPAVSQPAAIDLQTVAE